MKKLYRIHPDGSIEGLHDDLLAGVGTTKVQRASRVEFNEDECGWTVEFLVGRYAGCFLPATFPKRKDALEAEVLFLNQEMREGRL